VFNTPLSVARPIAAAVVDRVGTVCDPSCGTGTFLVAAGEALVGLGLSRGNAAALLTGVDIDPAAAAVARARVREWSGGVEPTIVVGDALSGALDGRRWEHVVGNPPFVDGSHARFLERATAWSSSIGLVLPVSVLATNDGRAARAAVASAGLGVASLTMLGGDAFDASVDTCALVLKPGVPVPSGSTWSGLLGDDVPDVALGGAPLGDSCEVVAGFRQHFYGLRGHVHEGGDGLPLVTSGAIEPGSWGGRSVRFDGVRYSAPRVSLDGVSPSVQAWFRALLRPKVVVATQTRVLEAAADADGVVVPSVPVISVVPTEPARLCPVLAVLLSPPVSAWAIRSFGGAALGAGALKLGCGQVRQVPTPCSSVAAWDRAAALLREGGSIIDAGALMGDAYGLSDEHGSEVHAWWVGRLR
jgi:predicted RNA methylase